MKYFFLLLFFPSLAFAGAHCIDGVITFDVDLATAPGTFPPPRDFEINLATCPLQPREEDSGGFASLDEYESCKANKMILRRKIRQLRETITGLSDFPIIQIILMRRLVWLLSYNNSLP